MLYNMLLLFPSIFYLLNSLPEINGQEGICRLLHMTDVGPSKGTQCDTPGAQAYSNRCCLDGTTPSTLIITSTTETTPTTSLTIATTSVTKPTEEVAGCVQMGMIDLGPSIGDACDGDAVSYNGRCCIEEASTSTASSSTITSTSTSTSATSTSPSPTTISSTASTTPSTLSTTQTSPSTSTPPNLYKNGKFIMKCIDVEATPSCLIKIMTCLTNKVKMAYTCCGSCYQIFPTFLPKLKQCVDDFPDACDFWGKDHCSSSDSFGKVMMSHCKKTCNNCPKQ